MVNRLIVALVFVMIVINSLQWLAHQAGVREVERARDELRATSQRYELVQTELRDRLNKDTQVVLDADARLKVLDENVTHKLELQRQALRDLYARTGPKLTPP
jgi:hypothetical protein